jgi:hypothetical protein
MVVSPSMNDKYTLNSTPLRILDQFNIVTSFLGIQWEHALNILHVSATQMFQVPAVVTMTVAATRMHRSLVDFASVSPDA